MAAVIGLDLSSTSAGMCIDGDTFVRAPKGDLFSRARDIADFVAGLTMIDTDLVVIEALGTRHVQTAIALATVHALVLDELYDAELEPLMVPPAQLKQFATGKGNANKDQMLVAALRSGCEGETNDEADAWWLWALGCATFDVWEVDATQYRRDVLAKLGATQ